MANKSLAKSPTELTILVTGGAGFIGSHTCVELLAKGFNVVIVDDLSNSSEVAVERVRKIAGVGADRCAFHEANVLDRDAMEAIFDAQEGAFTEETAWDALKAAQQLPNPEDITSNTQWSIVYNNTDLTAKIVLRRHWDDVTAYALTENKLIEQ